MLPIVPTATLLTEENPVIPLARYAQLTQHGECQFFGVNDDLAVKYECKRYWTKPQRDWVNFYLNTAQQMLENVLHYTLNPRWISDEQIEVHNSHRYHTNWCNIDEPGIRASSPINVSAAINYASEPAVIGPIATTVTSADEIKIYHPGTTDEIAPSGVSFAGGNVTILIPKCRMVIPSKMVNDNTVGISPGDANNFETHVSVYRIYNDPSTQAVFTKLSDCSLPPCTEEDTTGCMVVLNRNTGFINANMATYDRGVWTFNINSHCQSGYYKVFLNYKTAAPVIPVENAMMQLAHALMPDSPCGCNWMKRYWANFRVIPEDDLSPSRLENPFSIADGGYMAYRWAMYNRFIRGGIA